MRLLTSTVLFIVISIAFPGEAYRILGVFPFNGKSHFVMFGRLMKELAERGHQVDVVSHFPLKEPFPNYNDVVSLAGTIPDLVNNVTVEMLINSKNSDGSEVYSIATLVGNKLCDLMNHPKLNNLIKNPPKDPPYDLVIVEILGSNCYLAMGQHLKVPVVGLISLPMHPWGNDMVANPDNTAYIPNLFSKLTGKMNFWDRVKNTLTNHIAKWQFNHASKIQDYAIKKYIDPHGPSVREAERNVSLILVNSHYSLNGVRPFTTAVVEVGGLHIDEREAILSNDLQKWLDESKDGFVYVSFGSMMKIESLPKKNLNALYTSLEKLSPIRVLMRIAKPEELPPGLPGNVLTKSWIPQLAVLMHRNARAFMTHGGLMGTQESIYCGVPMIGVPFFGDQAQNLMLYSKLNLAVTLSYEELIEEKIDAAFQAILHDPSYMEASKRISTQFRDRPMSPMDTAVFWIEYVVRYGGTNLRSPAMDLAPWQIALLDVYGFLLLCVALAVGLVIIILRKVKGVLYPSNVTRTVKSRKIQ